jgi:hypothetical protein
MTAKVVVTSFAKAAIITLGLALAISLLQMAGGFQEKAFLGRGDEEEMVLLADDDDDGADTGSNSRSGFTSGVNSNDGTGSGHTPVSRDRDRSRGDKTRDRTRDGKGGPRRDWSGGHTNDRSRRDSR